jgi:hypothetical protein
MKPVYSDMVSLTTQILREDNEDNGVLAVKIMLDANRTFKRDMDPHVQGFLDFVRDLYLNMKQTVVELLSEDSPGPPPSQSNMSIGASVSGFAPFMRLIKCVSLVIIFGRATRHTKSDRKFQGPHRMSYCYCLFISNASQYYTFGR